VSITPTTGIGITTGSIRTSGTKPEWRIPPSGGSIDQGPLFLRAFFMPVGLSCDRHMIVIR